MSLAIWYYKDGAADLTDFQHTLQRGQAEVRKEALGALGKLTEQAFR